MFINFFDLHYKYKVHVETNGWMNRWMDMSRDAGGVEKEQHKCRPMWN